MCKKLPGVRCGTHAWNKVAKEEAALNTLLSKASSYKRVPAPLRAQIDDQIREHALAKRDYYCTTQGLKKLEEERKNAANNGDTEKMAEIENILEQARLDREDHDLAERISTTQGDTRTLLSSSEDVTHARRNEEKANQHLASLMRTQGNTQKATLACKKTKEARIIAEHRTLRNAVGISPNAEPMKCHQVNLSDNRRAFIYLPSNEFGKVRGYVPHGAYCQVTNISPDGHGNYILTLENGIRQIPTDKEKKILVD